MKEEGNKKQFSTIVLEDYAPNEEQLYDESGKVIGYAGDIWKTNSSYADLSLKEDTVTGPMENKPEKGGVTFRMIELLPGGYLKTNKNILNYYCVIKGELVATSNTDVVVAKKLHDIIQLKDAEMLLQNNGNEPVMFAHYLVDAE